MKKILTIVLFVSVIAAIATSCASSHYGAGKGCPTTNPRYFRG